MRIVYKLTEPGVAGIPRQKIRLALPPRATPKRDHFRGVTEMVCWAQSSALTRRFRLLNNLFKVFPFNVTEERLYIPPHPVIP